VKVFVDDERCKGHGMCCGVCPEVFDLTDDGYAVTLVTEVPEQWRQAVRTAVSQCPERAISIEE